MKNLKKIYNRIRKYQIQYLIAILSVNMSGYYGTRLLTKQRAHFDISIMLDKKIPFLPAFIIVYWGCYVFWAFMYAFIIVESGKEDAKSFTKAEILGKCICFFIYIVFPTTMNRGIIIGNSIWDKLVKILYQIDSADLLFPSIHCYVSWMCFIGLRKMKTISKLIKILVFCNAFLICISTLMVKQHVICDVLSGILIAELSFLLIGVVSKTKRGCYEE